MTHPRNRFTDREIRRLPEGVHADGNGLYVNVTESGFRQWILRTVIHGKRREMGLGGFPMVGLSEARELAMRYRKLARQGGDPFAERAKNRAGVPTFEESARKVHAEHAPTWKNEKHAAQWISTLVEYAFPKIGDKPVNAITSGDLLGVLSPIWLSKAETARRIAQRIGTVMNWAKAAGFRTDNPIEGIRKGLPKHTGTKGHFNALPYADVPGFIRDLRTEEANEQTKLAFEFLILTAARTSEVILATWTEFDLAGKVWTIPGTRMKAKKEHRVPLSDRCVEILKRARDLTEGTSYVFAVKGEPLSNMAFLMLLRRMERKATAHGFRSSFRDWASERTNFPNEVCEAALAHTVRNAVEAAYRRGDLFEKRRQLMSSWAAFCTTQDAKVRTLRSA